MNAPQSGPTGTDFKLPPLARRLVLGALAAAMVIYTGSGLVRDDVILPLRLFSNGRFKDLHFHGHWAWLGAAGVAFVVLAILIYVVQDFRTPPGQRVDHALADKVAWLGIIIVAVLTDLEYFGFIT